ncbi:MAG: sortase [Peptostreptococcaceae bacterium]
MIKSKKKISSILTKCGVLCILLAVILIGVNIYDDYNAGRLSDSELQKLQNKIPNITESNTNKEGQMPTIEIDGRKYIGVVEIPSISITLPVLDEWSEELLKVAPARYSGSIYDNDLIVMGHNYRRHFSKIKTLKKGDNINFKDVNGEVYKYSVVTLEKINGYDTDKMINNNYNLTLFTCDSTGENRVAVRCN